jgi:phosphate transport system substrate-binding protein
MRLLAVIALVVCGSAVAQKSTVTVTGSSSTAPYAQAWGNAFQLRHPGVTIRVVAMNSSAAPAAMINDASTIGMMSRPMNEKEREAVARKHRAAPLELKVALDALGIYVSKTNPLTAISVEQIESVFADKPRTGKRAATWGELGADGAWSSKAVRAFGFERGRGAYDLMRELALGGGEFAGSVSVEPVSSSVVQAVGVEPGGIGYASVYFRTARTRLLPVSAGSGEAVAPTDETIAAGQYPLARFLYFYVTGSLSGAPGQFLHFVLSEDGQELLKQTGGISIPRDLAISQAAGLATKR